jgi:hypothetical protein
MLSTVVTWRDRVELREALPQLVALAKETGGDLTIVNFGGSPRLLAAQVDGYSDALHVLTVGRRRYFNKALAQNVGAAHTSHGVLFFCDCDILLDVPTVGALVRKVAARDSTFGTLAAVRESKINSRNGRHVVCFGYRLRIRTADGRELHIVDQEEDAQDGSRNAPGLLVVRRMDFLAIDGYNSRLGEFGWGWDDQDMIARLTLGAGLTRIMEGSAIHLSHDDRARTGAYADADRWATRDRMFRQALSNYDRGDFSGTYSADVEGIRLDPAHVPAAAPHG